MSAMIVGFDFSKGDEHSIAYFTILKKTKTDIRKIEKKVEFTEVENISRYIYDLISEYRNSVKEVLIEKNNLGIAVLNRVKEIIDHGSIDFPLDDIKGYVTSKY